MKSIDLVSRNKIEGGRNFQTHFWFLILALTISLSPAGQVSPRLQAGIDDVVDSISVADQKGSGWLRIAATSHGEFGSVSYRSEIKAGFYSLQNKAPTQIWKLRDFNSNPLETISYSRNQYRLVDLDSNGQTDVFLWYSKVSDGLDPDTLKLFLYVNGVKYATRGRIPKLASEMDLYESKADANNSKAAPSVRQAMEKQWAEIVNPKLEALKAEAIE